MNREIQSRVLQIDMASEYSEDLENIVWAESNPSGLSNEVNKRQIFVYYSPDKFPDSKFVGRLKRLPSIKSVKSRIVYKKDWNRRWQRSVRPVNVSEDFVIIPPFKKYLKSVKELKKIIINPAMAFGTGHHESTLGIMRLIYKYREMVKGSRVADFGSGSGILSIFARMLGSDNVDAYDFDPECGNAIIENMRLNNVNGIKFFNTSIKLCRKRYDILFANMLFGEIASNKDIIKKSLKKSGLAFFAGILRCERDNFIRLFPNMRLKDELILNDWISFIFENL